MRKGALIVGFIKYLAACVAESVALFLATVDDLISGLILGAVGGLLLFVLMFGSIGILIWLNIVSFESNLLNNICKVLSFAVILQIALVIKEKYREYLKTLKKVVEEI